MDVTTISRWERGVVTPGHSHVNLLRRLTSSGRRTVNEIVNASGGLMSAATIDFELVGMSRPLMKYKNWTERELQKLAMEEISPWQYMKAYHSVDWDNVMSIKMEFTLRGRGDPVPNVMAMTPMRFSSGETFILLQPTLTATFPDKEKFTVELLDGRVIEHEF